MRYIKSTALINVHLDFGCRHTPMIDGDREMIFFGG